MGFQLKRTFCSKIFATGPSKLGNVVCQMENQTKSRENQGDYIIQVHTRQKNRTQPKTVWRYSKSISSSEISGNYFRLPTEFQKALRGHPGPLQCQVPPFKATSQQKLGRQPIHPNPNLQTMRLNQFLNTAPFRQLPPGTLSLAKLNGSKISLSGLPFVYQNTSVQSCSHDSSDLPYVKDRLLSCASKSLDRIVQSPLVEETISSNRLSPAWDCFPTPLSVVRPVSL